MFDEKDVEYCKECDGDGESESIEMDLCNFLLKKLVQDVMD